MNDPALPLKLVTALSSVILIVSTAQAKDPIAQLAKHPSPIANIHPPGKVDVPDNLRFCVKDPMTLTGLVLDEVSAELVGKWQYSTHTPPYVGYGYLHDQNDGKGEKQVIYRFQVAGPGRYEVRISHCYNVRRSQSTLVTVTHARGRRSIRINQQTMPEIAHLWRSLGNYRFRPGNTNSVTISNRGANDGYVVAAAVQIIKLKN